MSFTFILKVHYLFRKTSCNIQGFGNKFSSLAGLSTLSKVGGYFEKVGGERGARRG